MNVTPSDRSSLGNLSELFFRANATTVGVIAVVGAVALGVFYLLRNTSAPSVAMPNFAKSDNTDGASPERTIEDIAPEWLSEEQRAIVQPLFDGTSYRLSKMTPVVIQSTSDPIRQNVTEPTWFRVEDTGLLSLVIPTYSSLGSSSQSAWEVPGTISVDEPEAGRFVYGLTRDLIPKLLNGETVVKSQVRYRLRTA